MISKIIKLVNNTKAVFKFDDTPKPGSDALVTSGGIYTALMDFMDKASSIKQFQLGDLSTMDAETTLDGDVIVYLTSEMTELATFNPKNIYCIEVTMDSGDTAVCVLTSSSTNSRVYEGDISSSTVKVVVEREAETEPWEWSVVIPSDLVPAEI